MTSSAASRISSRRAKACGDSFRCGAPSSTDVVVETDMSVSRPVLLKGYPCQEERKRPGSVGHRDPVAQLEHQLDSSRDEAAEDGDPGEHERADVDLVAEAGEPRLCMPSLRLH